MEIGRLARAAFPNSSRVKRGKTHVYTGISKKARVDEGGTGVTESEKCAKSDGMLLLTTVDVSIATSSLCRSGLGRRYWSLEFRTRPAE